jgi:serine/threonine protein kinase/predicted ATPase
VSDDSRRERWRRVEELFHAGLGLPASERTAFLDDRCRGDARLRDEVDRLLSVAPDAEHFLEPSVSTVNGDDRVADTLAIGSHVGPYRVTALLGSGGMGDVYRAYDLRLDRNVALKILPDRDTHDPSLVERFTREARAASALNHPNIVTIHEVGETETARFIVMELVDGQTLRAMMRKPAPSDVEGPASLESFADIGLQIARALAVAHAAGIIHRDIKPENVMVRADGYVKLLDFGLAHTVDARAAQSETETTLETAPGIPFGTVDYMSPEQARGETMTWATDVFSFGVVMYELATGQRPFTADTEVGVLHQIISGLPHPPSRLNPGIPRTLEGLILQMLEKDARLRPSAVEVEAALSGIVGTRNRAESRRPAHPGERRHTVGRQHERAELRRAFDATTVGRGRLVCVAGEPGIGKTTLVEDFLSELPADGPPCCIGRGRCSERLAGAEAYLPWLEALESLLQGECREPVARAMKLLAPTWYHWVVPLAAVNGPPAPAISDAPLLSPERMKRELCAFVQNVTQLRPLVLFFDDVHWADVSTIDLLAYVGTKFEALPVLIVASYRPSELLLADHPFVRIKLELQARGACTEMTLPFLTTDDVERYLALEFPEHRFPADLQAAIQARTEGNPLFTVELVRYLHDCGVIGEKDGHWVLARSLPEFHRDLPESVRSMIQTRIAQLDEADHGLLVAASVQGYEFDSATVSRALGMNGAQTEERLDRLERVHGLVTLVREQQLPDQTLTARYRFVHVLYQNALYASLRPTRKVLLSGAVAESLIASYGKQDFTIASELAILLEAARNFERAAEYFLLAAEQAAHRSANREAVVLARRGLDTVGLLPQTPQRLSQELGLQIVLGPALMTTVGWGAPEVEAVYRRARELCHQVVETAQLFPVIWGLWQYWLARAEYQTARELGEQLLALASKIQDPALLLMAHHALSNTDWQSGDFERARMHAERAVAIYRPHEHHSLAALYGGHDSGVANRSRLAVNLWLLGYPDQALARSRDAIALARDIAHSTSVVLALVFDAMILQQCRDVNGTRHHAEEAVSLATDLALGPWLAWGTALRGWATAAEGRAEEGIADLQQAVAGWTAAGVGGLRPYFLALLAEVYTKTGQRDRAVATLAEAFAVTRQTREGYVQAELHRLRGELLADPVEAERCFVRAIEIARRQKAKSFELRAVMSLSRLRAGQGRVADARQILAAIYGRFTEGFETGDLTQAGALLGAFRSAEP